MAWKCDCNLRCTVWQRDWTSPPGSLCVSLGTWTSACCRVTSPVWCTTGQTTWTRIGLLKTLLTHLDLPLRLIRLREGGERKEWRWKLLFVKEWKGRRQSVFCGCFQYIQTIGSRLVICCRNNKTVSANIPSNLVSSLQVWPTHGRIIDCTLACKRTASSIDQLYTPLILLLPCFFEFFRVQALHFPYKFHPRNSSTQL